MPDAMPLSAVLPQLTAVLYVLEDILDDVWRVGSATFSDKRRMLWIARKLQSHARAQNVSCKSYVSNSIEGFLKITDSFIKEADICYRSPYDDNLRDRKQVKLIWYKMVQSWDNLSILLLEELDHSNSRADFENIKANDYLMIWKLIGFSDRRGFLNYIEPRTESMVRTAIPAQLSILKTLIEKGTVSEISLKDKGFNQKVLVETFNPLLRDEYLRTDYQGTYELTEFGKIELNDLMVKLNPSNQMQVKAAKNTYTRLKEVWKDPVWSKVIASAITGLALLIASYFLE